MGWYQHVGSPDGGPVGFPPRWSEGCAPCALVTNLIPTTTGNFWRSQGGMLYEYFRIGLDHGIGHFMIFEVD
jgi:hypothetical protein